jgi:phospholipid-binding lipoprotein MlaA
MRYYYLIMMWLVAAAGCASSARDNSSLTAESPAGVNSSGEAAFDEFEEEFSQSQVTIPDPLESSNRLMYGINDRLYFWVAKPVIQTYEKIVPRPARVGIGNFFDNLTTPARLVNCLLQGKCTEADRELSRFGINTTVGILGFGDPALDRWNIVPADEDLGQTLAVYGFGDGFYIVWPVFGPSTLRDSIGMAGDSFLNPVRYVKPSEVSIGISVFQETNNGSFHIGQYEAFKSASVEPYVAMRGIYIQYRSKQIEEETDVESCGFDELP